VCSKDVLNPAVQIAATAVTIHGGGGHIYDYQFDLNEKTQSHRELIVKQAIRS
jgi:hypothetical protein